MADFLGGLLSGGGGLYDDLLTPQQQSQLSGRGLLSMAGAFADAAMPSRFPVPLGAALGKAAAAMGSGRDEAALSLLKAGMTAQEIKAMRQKMALNEQISPILLRIAMQNLGAAGGAPAAGPPVVPGAAPVVPARPAAAPTTAPLPPAAAALPGTPEASAALFGGDSAAGEYGVGQYDVGQGISPPPARAAVLPSLDSPITPAERLAWQKTVGPGATYLPVEDWVAQQRARVPAGGPSAQPPDAPPGAGSSLNDRYSGILAMAGGSGGASGSSLPPPDELIRQGSGPGGLLQAGYAGAPPFGADGDEVGSGASVPAGTRYNMPMLRSLAESVGFKGQDADTMAATWMGESGGNPFAKKVDAREASYGLAQINARAHPGGEQAYGDPDYAARKSYDLYQKSKARGGSGFGDWSIYNSGAYKRYLPGGVPDEVIGGSGGGVPGFTRAQYSGGGLATPPGAGAALATPSGGVIPGTGMTAQQLGALNALTKMGGLGDPFNSLLETYYKSPGYLGEAAGATKRGELGVELELRPKLEAAIAWAKIDPNINEAERKAQIERYSKQLEQMRGAELEPAPNGILVPDGAGGMKRVQATKLQAAQAAAGLGVPALGISPLVNPPAGSGAPAVSPVGEPVLTSGQQASDTKMAETSVTEYKAANDAARQANGRIQQYGQMAQAAQGFTSGPNAERWYVLKSQLKDLGWIKGTDVPDMEVFQNAARKMQVIAAPKGQGGVSNYERELFASTVPQIVTSPEGLAKAIDIARRLDEYDVKVAGIHRDVAQSNRGRPDSLAADARIAALGPPITPEEMQALDALRSQGGAGAAAAPTQSAPATPGAIKTPYGTITPVR